MSQELRGPKEQDGAAPRVVEGEVLDGPEHEKASAQTALRRILARVVLSAVLGAVAAALCVIGILLTVTVIGAAVGLPLVLLGAALAVAAAWILFGGGTVLYRSERMDRTGGGHDKIGNGR